MPRVVLVAWISLEISLSRMLMVLSPVLIETNGFLRNKKPLVTASGAVTSSVMELSKVISEPATKERL